MRRFLAFIYNYLFSNKRINQFNNLKKRNISNIEANKEYQIKKLLQVLGIAISNIPYYRDLRIDFDPENFTYKDFQRIPILTKDSIRKDIGLMRNREFHKINEVFKNTSGGSTGEPLAFFQTKEHSQHGMANYYYALHLNGVDIYDASVDLWGAARDMHNSNETFDIRSIIHNKYRLNTFVLSDSIMSDYVSRLNRIKPKFIKAYVHSLYELAKYVNKHNIKIKFKPVIHCTTGPLYPEMRTEIKKAFNQAHVYNFYGSREVSAIASEVKEKKGLHVLFDNVFVEILDENNIPVEKGVEGEVVITTLNNHYMPLIRYRIGDRAIKGDDMEFGTLILDEVVGRTLGVIYRNDGSKIDGQFFTTLFFNNTSIMNFQLVQKSISSLLLNIVKTDAFDPNELREIIKKIETELPKVEIETVFCERINLTNTGKIMYVYSELD